MREEWFGITNGPNLFINKLWPLIDVKMCFCSISSEQMDEFCICIDMYKIHVVSNTHYI